MQDCFGSLFIHFDNTINIYILLFACTTVTAKFEMIRDVQGRRISQVYPDEFFILFPKEKNTSGGNAAKLDYLWKCGMPAHPALVKQV